MSIAADMLRHLDETGLTVGRRIVDIVLTQGYCGVVIDTGAAGWALNYAPPADDLARHETYWLSRTVHDPLLRRALFDTPAPPEIACLRTALLAALSEPVLAAPEHYGLRSLPDLPDHCLDGARDAAVVGFGGLMWRLLGRASLRSLSILDLGLPLRRTEMDNVAAAMRLARPDVTVHLSDGHGWRAIFERCDTLSVTGSTMCNDTLDAMLATAGAGQTVIVQGQSAALHPRALFERGVAAVLTTRKPPQLVALARSDRSGAALQPWFEGGNARVCLLRAEPVVIDARSARHRSGITTASTQSDRAPASCDGA